MDNSTKKKKFVSKIVEDTMRVMNSNAFCKQEMQSTVTETQTHTSEMCFL